MGEDNTDPFLRFERGREIIQYTSFNKKNICICTRARTTERRIYLARLADVCHSVHTHALIKSTKSIDYHGNLLACDLTRNLSSISLHAPMCIAMHASFCSCKCQKTMRCLTLTRGAFLAVRTHIYVQVTSFRCPVDGPVHTPAMWVPCSDHYFFWAKNRSNNLTILHLTPIKEMFFWK
jgi:hypothetical protein